MRLNPSCPPGKGPGLGQRLGPGAQEDSEVRALARVDGDVDAGAKSLMCVLGMRNVRRTRPAEAVATVCTSEASLM